MNATETCIRDIRPEDNAAVQHLVQHTLLEFNACGDGYAGADAETLDMYSAYNKPGHRYFVVEQGGRVLGAAGIGRLLGGEAGVAELRKMYFDPALRGQGLGARLLQHCLDAAREMGYQQLYLETLPDMLQAQKLYRKFGFKRIDHRLGETGHFGCPVWMLLDLQAGVDCGQS